MIAYLGMMIPFVALSIPLVAIILSYKQKSQKNKLRELELQKEIIELEIQKQNNTVKLLDAENEKLDKIIYEKTTTPP
ncbi:MAG: hypothetical protein LBG76_08000 [Treponema sp.]|jgi:hypothetical protein|nr:hypothetical protein [Treponema sp.]